MAQTGSWNGYKFSVKPKLIRSFEEMTLKGSCETETKSEGNQNYVRRKNGDPMELSFTVTISALLGVTDVRKEALGFVKSANRGDSAYFYYGHKKLLSTKMMLTSAEVTDIDPLPKHPSKWIGCSVRLVLKQGGGNADDGSDNGSKKASVKGSGAKAPAKQPGFWTKATDQVKKVAAGIAAVNKVIAAAKQASGGKLTGTGAGGLSYQESVVKNTQQTKNTGAKSNVTTGTSCTFTPRLIIRQTKPAPINVSTF